MKIVSWNVRGLNEGEKRLRVRNLLHGWRADVVCLQETKLRGVSERMVRSLWRGRHVGWVALASCGAAGGIVVLWDRRVVEKVDEAVGVFSVSCRFRNVVDHQE